MPSSPRGTDPAHLAGANRQSSRVELVASVSSVKSLAPLTVTVKTHGGAGPVVGVMLTDNDMRFSSSPVQTAGFYNGFIEPV